MVARVNSTVISIPEMITMQAKGIQSQRGFENTGDRRADAGAFDDGL
jgi:hypothetical protein